MKWRGPLLLGLASTVLVVPFGCKAGPDYSAGVSALKAGDYEQALTILRPLAESGNRDAIVRLGDMYAFGWGMPVNDVAADDLFRKAEERGVVPGQSQLDVAFELRGGGGVQRDATRAQRWLQKAADLGHPRAVALVSNSEQLQGWLAGEPNSN